MADVKPTLAFNNSLSFSKPYVQANLAQDHTGPSVWWPQRYPYNPGSVNASKAEGWTVQHYSKDFAIYTYAYDVSGIAYYQALCATEADQPASVRRRLEELRGLELRLAEERIGTLVSSGATP